MVYQSEFALENEMMEQLESNGYETVTIRNEQQLLDNFRAILNERHADKFKDQPLTDKEFQRLLTMINGKSIFESARILRDKLPLKRDDETEEYLSFLDTKNWCKNKFQITNQVSVNDKYKARYDVTILVNGLPLVQIELKRRGVDINEAFNQVMRYRKQNYTGLFRYIQLFVISNGVETRYLSNNDGDILKSHMFYWSDKDNKRINNLSDFTNSFLRPCQLAKMISRYMIINETDHILMAMRPYQVHAVEALINQATETNNNGYIWHTTGSGKTLTSFKASQILSEQDDIQKVIFLVDRKDLDSQTEEEFNKFAKGAVDKTNNTSQLVRQLNDRSLPLIVTTIQKMSKAIQSNPKALEQYKTNKVVFIIDECHRSQFGDMHRIVRQHFNNAQYFGFTGTPRFEENKSQDGRSTADIFGRCLHTYLIKNAIHDGNVLGFSVDYINTIKTKNIDLDSEELVEGINKDEVWLADDRIRLIARYIVENHDKYTRNRQYSAILTVQSIPALIKFYNVFKEISKDYDKPLNIAGVYSYSPNEESTEGNVKEKHSRDSLDEIIADYNATFGTNFSTDTFQGYFNHISNSVKKGVKDSKIDVLIVVNMFLTGFDSKVLNTLYVDRNLKHHDLIQAYSRTNRVEKETKPFGKIVNYRNLKRQTDEALKLFSQTEDTDRILMRSYEEYLSEFVDALAELKTIAQNPEDMDNVFDENDKKSFVEAFRLVSKLVLRLKTFEEFNFTNENIGMGEQEFEDYKSKYFAIYDEVKNKHGENEKVTILNDIDFEIEILRNDLINVSYIMELVRKIDLKDKEEQQRNREQIRRILDNADDPTLRLKRDLIREFIDEVVPKLSEEDDIDEVYLKFENAKREEEFKKFAHQQAVDEEILKAITGEFEFSGIVNQDELKDLVGDKKLREKRQTKKAIASFIEEVTSKYSF
ncbi:MULTISPECIES: type I restriction endonuclease subunit R [Mammaliicoccus]|uniref:Type I restriction enzyme endonuclease subunit n=2 Tax=Mammaliicoccus sciuri TaxID=1296 RepID=A0AAW5LMW3_MAMSC|nr:MULTISPECIES: type I restriction endonuclease subunit R [Mammaliicoccus]MBG9211538.1 type I restriction endonuclease subunit R [Mammaliicoccus sciuri]MCD5140055.1 type I restriction endonuclease subunit R [Mammaliicoccus sciuri]MCQ9303497.1 type I restriction endonuclease subunit R [Mammaliicoccus sciuri]MDT0744961.1 type I restriction endonuclease subunit R [Mammaliicoccus sciuri]MDT0752730.1 type I restriction endonuclease subunit R [Mammaliicoccus sciuri]